MRIRSLAILLVMMLSAAFTAGAQSYRYEIGAGLGMSGYIGDANKSNMFKNPGFAGGFLFRYVMNYRFAIKGALSTASLSANSADFDDYFPGGETYKFSSQVYNLDAQFEFNFFNYGIGYKYKRLHRLVPYLALGVGATMASCDGNSTVAFSLPMSAGAKFKVSERLNLGLEFTMRKVFSDKVDNFTLDDLNGIKSSFMKNTDWCSTIMLSVTYEFGKRCTQCHYVE